MRPFAGIALLAAALVLQGCIVFKVTPTATQLNTIGAVRVIIEVCASRPVSCPDRGNIDANMTTNNANTPGPDSVNGQVLLAVRVSSAAIPPATFSTTGGRALTFNLSPSYAAAMETSVPAAAGTKWVGYVSDSILYSSDVGAQSFTADIDFELGQGADGVPFQTPFRYRPVVGMRSVDASHPADRPVFCHQGSEIQAASDDLTTFCADSPAKSTILAGTTLSRATRDLGIRSAGSLGTVAAGGTVSIPFLATYSGAAPGAGQFFVISASTPLAGATALPTSSSLTPTANSANPINVAVGVPADATPGDYPVTLSATLGSQTRTGTGTLTVSPPDGPGGGDNGGGAGGAHTVTIVLPPKLSSETARKRGIVVLIGSTVATRATVTLKQGGGKRRAVRTLDTARKRLKVPGPVKVTLTSNKLKGGRYVIGVTAPEVSGSARGKLRR